MTSRSTHKHNVYQQQYYAQLKHAKIRPVSTPYVLRHVDKVIEAADLRPGLRVLEVGAGMGRFALLMRERHINVVASDLSPELIQSLKKAVPDIETIVCDVAKIAESTHERFERAVGFFILHHLPDVAQAFQGLRRVLKPGGRVAFCEPNAYYLPFYAQIVCSPSLRWKAERGVLNMRPSFVLAGLHRAGLVDLRVERFGFFPPSLANTQLGRTVERRLEEVALLRPLRAFQIFSGRVPE